MSPPRDLPKSPGGFQRDPERLIRLGFLATSCYVANTQQQHHWSPMSPVHGWSYVHTGPDLQTAFSGTLLLDSQSSCVLVFLRRCTLVAHGHGRPSDTRFGLKCVGVLFEVVHKMENVTQKSLFLASVEKVEDLTTCGLCPHSNNWLMLEKGPRWKEHAIFMLLKSPLSS